MHLRRVDEFKEDENIAVKNYVMSVVWRTDLNGPDH